MVRKRRFFKPRARANPTAADGWNLDFAGSAGMVQFGRMKDILIYLFFAAWLTGGGFVGAEIGKRRDNQLGGFLLGAFLGPVGWIVASLIDNRPRCSQCSKHVSVAILKPHDMQFLRIVIAISRLVCRAAIARNDNAFTASTVAFDSNNNRHRNFKFPGMLP
jgi:hypothetical protein